jgi:hypothetical protein
MRIAIALCSIVWLIAISSYPSESRAQAVSSVPFVEGSVTTVPLVDGFYVFRDEAEWAEKFVREFPGNVGPPPAPDFTDSLVVAVSYGMSGCTGTGGEIESIEVIADTVRIHLDHVYQFNIVCLAELPRQYFYRIAHADVPSDAAFEFAPAELPYDVEPARWYPLAVGNAWHFQTYGDLRWANRVEVVQGSVELDGEVWYNIVRVFDDSETTSDDASRFLRWTDDAFLLTSTDPAAYVDTVHASLLESPFQVNVPRKDVQLKEGGSKRIYVGINNFAEFGGHVALWDDSFGPDEVSYVHGVGPLDGLVAAIIDGEHFEDTSLIQTVLTSPRSIDGLVAGRIDVFPHPFGSEGVIEVMPARSGDARIFVYDALGRQVLEARTQVSAGSIWRLRLGESMRMAPGLYVIRLIEEGGRSAERSFIVAR